MISREFFSLTLVALAAVTASGCSGSDAPELATVEGTVTLNGEPLVGAEVVFRPEAKGRSSIGRTDMDGRYSLIYTPEQPGAIKSKHKVTISTRVDPDSDSDDPFLQKGRKELVPAKYNKESTLEVDLTAEASKKLDFLLEGAPHGRS